MPFSLNDSFNFAASCLFVCAVTFGCAKSDAPPESPEVAVTAESETLTAPETDAPEVAAPEADASTVDYAPAESEPIFESLAALDGKAEFIGPTIGGSHASTIAETPDGTLVAAWLGQPEPDNNAIVIWGAIFRDGRWTDARIFVGVPDDMADFNEKGWPNRLWNPVLFQEKDGALYLFYKVGFSTTEWRAMIAKSLDGGETWTHVCMLPEGFSGPVKNKPVRLADGTLLAPSSTEAENGDWTIHLERATDIEGEWTRTEPLNDPDESGAIQPSVLFHSDGRLQLVCRNKDGDENLWTLWSSDGGATWSKMEQLAAIPNPNSGVDAVTLRDGRQLLVYNHSTTKTGDRSCLHVAVSDDGINWRAVCVLENEPGPNDYSYPAVIQTSDGKVQITYTWRWARIKRVMLDPEKIVGVPIVDGVWPEEVK